MTAYEVTQVSDRVREWKSGKGAEFLSYRVTLKAGDREITNVELSRPAGSPAPAAGMTVEGTIDESGNYGPKLQEPRAQGGGGRGKSPEERRSIAMQHAQKCAVTILEVAAAHGEYVPPNAGDVVGQVKTVAAALFAQVVEAERGS